MSTRAADRVATDARGAATSWVHRIEYPLLGRLIHRPSLLRKIARFLPRIPFGGLIGSYQGVVAVLDRQASFSNTAHQTDLPVGTEFVIAMDGGPLQRQEREFLALVLAPAESFGEAAAAKSVERIAALSGRPFDLIDDYLMDIVWAGIRESFGSAATVIESYGGGVAGQSATTALYMELRYVGAQLIGGAKAPESVRLRAQEMAARLARRVADCEAAIANAWGQVTVDGPKLRRNAIGLMWVGHPATVQAGALIMQELIERPDVYATLREEAAALGSDVWGAGPFRTKVHAHVIELLRFRPPFPILNRDVPRDTFVEADGRTCPCKAGSLLEVITIGAMFDSASVASPDAFDPDPSPGRFTHPDNRYLMFGWGARSCIAKHQVVETLTSALTGLLTLPELRYEHPRSPMTFDGPIIEHMRLR